MSKLLFAEQAVMDFAMVGIREYTNKASAALKPEDLSTMESITAITEPFKTEIIKIAYRILQYSAQRATTPSKHKYKTEVVPAIAVFIIETLATACDTILLPALKQLYNIGIKRVIDFTTDTERNMFVAELFKHARIVADIPFHIPPYDQFQQRDYFSPIVDSKEHVFDAVVFLEARINQLVTKIVVNSTRTEFKTEPITNMADHVLSKIQRICDNTAPSYKNTDDCDVNVVFSPNLNAYL